MQSSHGLVIIAVFGIVLLTIFNMAIWASRYTKVGPNQVLIVSGRKRILPDGKVVGFRFVKGGGTFVMPVLEKVDVLSLEVFSIELPPAKGRAADGAPLEADCAAQLKIKSDDASLEAAAEHFLNKKPDEIKSVVRPVLEKHLRAALGSTNLAAVQQNPDALASQMESAAASGLAKMGLDIISFTVHDVRTA